MKHLKFTYVDAVTGTPVSEAPAGNGPKFPDVPGLEFAFALETRYPTSVPEFFGTCPDETFALIPGVIDVLTQADFETVQAAEMMRRREIRAEYIKGRIATIEQGQARAVREAALGNPTYLQQIEAKIAALRSELISLA